MSITTLRRLRPRSYSIVPAAVPPGARSYYAFTRAGDTVASLYLDGAWVEDRGTTAELTGPEVPLQPCVVIGDAFVGDGSLVAAAAEGTGLQVWDVAGDVVYSYAEEGWHNQGACYLGGWLYWIEAALEDDPTGTRAFRLRRARADLTSNSVLGSTTSTVPAGYEFLTPARRFGMTAIGALLEITWQHATLPEVLETRRIAVALEGAPWTEEDASALPAATYIATNLGLPVDAGEALCLGAEGATPRVLTHGPAEDYAASLLVPATWEVGSRNVAISPGGADLVVYGDVGGTSRLIRHPFAVPFGVAPAVDFEVEAHPTLEIPPSWMWPVD
ncbi:MAG TPA: hypothetical protein VF017_15565 [Thermoanaerobaculia bacterium]|nr:hypothetical protein [Thermoanaerobaculia bacterium]